MPPRQEPVTRSFRGPEGATREDLRNLRRWVVVAGVWAVAATAVALIALLDGSDDEARKDAEAAAARITATERKLDARIDDLEERLDDLPRSEDVSKLQQRLSRAESGVAKASAGAKSAEDKLRTLEKRVQTVEDDAAAADSADEDSEP